MKTPRGALDILEEAVHLLRLVPVSTLLIYYIGTLPFILGLLYFWTDMSRAANADRYLPEAALAVSLLYIWMKSWQSGFASNLLSRLLESPAPRFSLRRCLRIVSIQMILQPYSLFIFPASVFLAMLPFGWALAYFQNAVVFGNGEDFSLRNISRRSWQNACLWPGQNHVLLLALLLFTFVVFLNVTSVLIILPQLLKMLFGIETLFTLSGMHVLNTTFFAVSAGVTYLIIDPLIAVIYTLRCFYGESIESGADLVAELKGFAGPS